MNDEERALINAWVERLVTALRLDGHPFEMDEILGLAGDVARTVVRPAAPLTTFIVGYAAGLSTARGIQPKLAIREAIATAEELTAK